MTAAPRGRRGPGQGATRREPSPAPGDAPDPAGLAARRTAAKLLGAVVEAHTPLDALTDGGHGHPHYLALDQRDRGLVRAILGVALRHRVSIEALIASRLDRPLPAGAGALSHILHVGAAQILFLDVPDSAAVNLAVAHAKSDPRTARFDAVVNAVLRAVARRKERALPGVLEKTVDAPQWFDRMLRDAYGEETAHEIHRLHRIEAPTDFTVRADPERWAEALGGIVLPNGSVRVARLDRAVPELPGFADGAWWVQDAAASLPARLLGDVAGLRVADLCAAPGGKTAQLAAAGAKVTAVDASRNRLKRLAENLARLGLEASVVEADVCAWRPETLFDAVLLDAPCSSTGTVRRHPDVPWTKSEADVLKLTALQRRLLDAAVKLVRPGGRLVFSNCSLDPREGEALAEAFLSGCDQAAADPIAPDEFPGVAGFVSRRGELRTTPAGYRHDEPALSGLDGFFALRVRRLS